MTSVYDHYLKEVDIGRPVYTLTYILMAMTGLGYLALTWSTVVLLGGFVTSLQRKDFWCLTVISMMQAARIFNDLGEKLAANVFQLVNKLICYAVFTMGGLVASDGFCSTIFLLFIMVLWLLFLVACCILLLLYGYCGPITCIALALWRIVQRDYGSNDADMTKANLAPALDLFYGLILCQGALYMIWLFLHLVVAVVIVLSPKDYNMPRKWGYIWLVDYFVDVRAKSWRDPASIKDSTISRYAVDLIDSKSWDDQLSGMRMLATFIKEGADVRSLLLLPSRPIVQKLINTLGWRDSASREMREVAACIVAHLAGDIHLAQFPGAIQCISTLLHDEVTLKYWWNSGQKQGPSSHLNSRYPSSTMHELVRKLNFFSDDDDEQHKEHEVDEDGGGCNELILQGLTILEKLASDHHNCVDISSTPGLLPKVMAPLCSDTLIQGVKNNAWAEVVNGTFKVLYSLIRCPGLTGESLRQEIATSKQAISNLESFLDQNNEDGQELQMRAVEMLTELALDSSTNLTKETIENLIKKQLEIFLEKESTAIFKELKATAGTTLVLLTNSSEENSSIVNGSVVCLTEMLDAKNNTTYRIIAAQILENICAHCDLDKERVKDTLLPQLLAELRSNKREPSQPAEENQQNTAPAEDEQNQSIAPGIDEENQNNAPGNDDENHNISAQEGNTEIQQISSTTDQNKSSDQGNDEQITIRELQAAFLSLTLVIYDKVISTDDFDDAVQKNGLGSGEFVVKLKTVVQENCKETVTGLKIVKLCGQIAASMLLRNQYTEHFKNQGFVEHLSEAKKIMSNLESCILFAGTDPRLKKVATPLLYELEKEVVRLVG